MIVTSRDSCCPIGCQIKHVLGIVCKSLQSELTYRLEVSFIIKLVCCCIKPQRYMVSESGWNLRFRLVNHVT